MGKPFDYSKVGTAGTPSSDDVYRNTYGTYKDPEAAKSEKERSLGSSLPMAPNPFPAKGLK